MKNNSPPALRALPSVDFVMNLERAKLMGDSYGRDSVITEVKQQLNNLRTEILAGNASDVNRDQLADGLLSQTETELSRLFSPSLQPVINLTGVVLHTNLGRAPYPQVAIDAMLSVAGGATNLEFQLATGKRGRRDDHVEHWICRLTGAEAATTVNNNAAAVLLVLNTLAKKKEVIVSRGELIEIGGSFRMPAIMKKASCKLREVGTTNRTHLKDYRQAISKKTAALMKVHTSNYEINGFNQSVDAQSLAALSSEFNIPLIDDLGSGSLIDLAPFGLGEERTAREAIDEGVDIITFSGDKLLGGPQCGIIAGRKSLIEQIDKNPMKRAMRLDKITLAALEAVLKLYTRPEKLADNLPALRVLSRSPDSIKKSAQRLQTLLQSKLPAEVTTSVENYQSQIGSGALPTRTIRSFAVKVTPTPGYSAEKLASAFRNLNVPVIGRIKNDCLWFDCRNMESDKEIEATLQQLPAVL